MEAGWSQARCKIMPQNNCHMLPFRPKTMRVLHKDVQCEFVVMVMVMIADADGGRWEYYRVSRADSEWPAQQRQEVLPEKYRGQWHVQR